MEVNKVSGTVSFNHWEQSYGPEHKWETDRQKDKQKQRQEVTDGQVVRAGISVI